MSDKKTGLALLREPFPEHQISLLPKPFKKESLKGNCTECGGYHGLPATHLKYVGHAALTDRLLDADLNWHWEPIHFKDGLPAFDESGGLWIRLTVAGQTRLGYGNATDSSFKEAGARKKEVIGDALRNAAMRFGAALELWHKGELHKDETDGDEPEIIKPKSADGSPEGSKQAAASKTPHVPSYEPKPKAIDPKPKEEGKAIRDETPINVTMENILLEKLKEKNKNNEKFYEWMEKTYGARIPLHLKKWQYFEVMSILNK
jgi:hypothetical protein